MPMTELCILGRDAEVRATPSGVAVCNLSLSYTYGKKGDDGRKPTQWLDAALWGQRAEAMAPHLLKGTKVVVTVEDVRIGSYQAADGTTKPKLQGNVIAISFVPMPRQDGSTTTPAPPPRAAAPRPAPAPAPRAPTGFADMDDDVPF